MLEVADPKLVPIKTGAGETDLQFRHLFFKDYTFLKSSEERSGLRPRLWPEGRGAHLALFPNLNAKDPVWRGLFRDRRFREALSLGIDRDLLSQFLYVGLAQPSNNSIIPQSPLFRDEYGAALHRLRPARPPTGCSTSWVSTSATGAAFACCPTAGRWSSRSRPRARTPSRSTCWSWCVTSGARSASSSIAKPSDRETLRNRIFAGETLMTIFYGIDNGMPTAAMPPREFAPTSQADQAQWPKWGQYYETKGAAGEAPDLPEAKRLMELFEEWQGSFEPERQAAIWAEMLDLYTSQCFTLGLVQEVRQPLAVRHDLRNVPKEAIFNWEPQGQIGLYRPDTFFYAE